MENFGVLYWKTIQCKQDLFQKQKPLMVNEVKVPQGHPKNHYNILLLKDYSIGFFARPLGPADARFVIAGIREALILRNFLRFFCDLSFPVSF
jgi:hypothetical protein